MNDDADTEHLLAAYADDPHSLRPDERARVEAWLAASGDGDVAGLRETVAEVRGLDRPGATPDWPQLEARIFAATTRAPRARWPWLVAGGVALAAAAVVALLVRPPASGPLLSAARPAPVVPDDAIDDDVRPDDEVAVDDDVAIDDETAALDEELDDSDLDGMGPADDELVEAMLALDDDANSDDDLPGSGATWTGWLDDLSDADLDRALAWLDAQERG